MEKEINNGKGINNEAETRHKIFGKINKVDLPVARLLKKTQRAAPMILI